ncbi:hypothetical protein MIND_00463100 [Mycena indigotica]|uniref:Rhodanese domain-containing protein n=1 Tax=Mycena indigotica TaxID=2126181 RepID=A0A8H6WBV1_9AGAR|nr:uncharacterized protein MIND_00463100 [Mycena indigotica]KAF7306714.1 hypothetical protein MIND_00463100 [Mycena indigotica]
MAARILVINPNSSISVTKGLEESLQAPPGTTLSFYTAPPDAPPSIDDMKTGVLSATFCFNDILARSLIDQHDGFLVSCFSDHPLIAMLRETTVKPVIGILEAAITHALFSGQRFGILSTGTGFRYDRHDEVRRFFGGATAKLAGIIMSGLGVVEIREGDPDIVNRKLRDTSKQLALLGSDVIILGCAAMAGKEQIVIDGAKEAGNSGLRVVDGNKAGVELLAVVLDCTWFMPNSPRVARAEFNAKRIVGSRFLDLDEVASPHELGLKHMMPSPQHFAQACGEKFGIEPSSHVVLYDAHGVFSSPRGLWMFKSFGHQNASILDGGLPRWEAEGFPVDTSEPDMSSPPKVDYPAPSLAPDAIRSYEQIVANALKIPLQTPDAEIVVDARSRGRFLGTDPEPRPGISSGHIPNSFSLPFNVFLEDHVSPTGMKYSTYLSEDKLRDAITEALGLERAQAVFKGDVSVTASCGSGMSAAILWLGLQLMGVRGVGLYDESWTGYGLRPTSVIEKSS